MTRVHEHPKKYDAFEQRLASRHGAFVRTAINKLNAILAKSRAVVAARLDTMRHSVPHTVDLPAGTDVNRLDHQTGRTRPDRSTSPARSDQVRRRHSNQAGAGNGTLIDAVVAALRRGHPEPVEICPQTPR